MTTSGLQALRVRAFPPLAWFALLSCATAAATIVLSLEDFDFTRTAEFRILLTVGTVFLSCLLTIALASAYIASGSIQLLAAATGLGLLSFAGAATMSRLPRDAINGDITAAGANHVSWILFSGQIALTTLLVIGFALEHTRWKRTRAGNRWWALSLAISLSTVAAVFGSIARCPSFIPICPDSTWTFEIPAESFIAATSAIVGLASLAVILSFTSGGKDQSATLRILSAGSLAYALISSTVEVGRVPGRRLAVAMFAVALLASIVSVFVEFAREQHRLRLLARRAFLAELRLRTVVDSNRDLLLVARAESGHHPGQPRWRIDQVLGELPPDLGLAHRDSLIGSDATSLGGVEEWSVGDLLDIVDHEQTGHERLLRTSGEAGAIRAYLLSVRPVSPGLLTLIARDITTEEAAREERERAFSQQLSALAINEHQIKTPLSAAIGWAELLAADTDVMDGSTRREAAERVVTIISRVVETINREIDLLKENGRTWEHSQPTVDAGLVLALSVQSFEAVLDGDVSLDAPAGLRAQCPAAIYRQITDQLLENAAKYSPNGGAIRVSARRDDGWIVTTVADHGIGIPEGANIFDPYVRGTDSGGAIGSGLGLHIVRTLTERYGGVASARRNPESGSTFEVRLPAALPE